MHLQWGRLIVTVRTSNKAITFRQRKLFSNYSHAKNISQLDYYMARANKTNYSNCQYSHKRYLTYTTNTTIVSITKKIIISKIIDTLWSKRVSEPTLEEILIDPLSRYNTTKSKSNSPTNLAPDFVYFEFTIIASTPSRHRNKIKLLSLSLF